MIPHTTIHIFHVVNRKTAWDTVVEQIQERNFQNLLPFDEVKVLMV